MERLPFDHYHDYFAPKMEDIQVHNDFMVLMDWLADKPGIMLSISDIARIITDGEPDRESINRAVGAAVVMTTWPQQLADTALQVMSASGVLYEAVDADDEHLAGRKPYVIETTGEVVEDFPRNAYPSFRVRDFEPRPAPAAIPEAGGPKP